ncbi:uncharacterized protein LOC131245451 [Magnolia sinica]|uniref:uncharacterized protein LOC131245451 n=1 Tax=Magnolia sinica TaxID=86752 RepID=UPI00265A75A6|nr:uncharacterized protein LOC131245451 [Magnolia sinica]
MDPIIKYLKDDNRTEAQQMKIKATRYTILNGILYKKGFYLPYMMCVRPEEAEYVVREIHEGICRNHSGGRALVHKVIRQGYYWLTIQNDVRKVVQRCDKCQRFTNNIICKFGIPRTIISGNGKQFNNKQYQEMCKNLEIHNIYSSPQHPYENGQVKVVNKIIKHHLRNKLENARGAWVEELPKVLWAYRTITRAATEDTPFSLAYGAEAVTPVDIGLHTA